MSINMGVSPIHEHIQETCYTSYSDYKQDHCYFTKQVTFFMASELKTILSLNCVLLFARQILEN